MPMASAEQMDKSFLDEYNSQDALLKVLNRIPRDMASTT